MAGTSRHGRGGDGARQPASEKVQTPAYSKSRAARNGRKAGHAKSGQSARKPLSQMTLVDFIGANAVYIVGVAAVVAVVAVLLVGVRSCVPTQTYDYDGELDFEYETPYNWDELQATESGRLVYGSSGQTGESRTGIDVSENQGEIDWRAVADDGIDFAMIRLGYRGATEGDLFEDATFAANLAGAKEAGVDCGVYFFSQALNEKEAREEADFVIKALDGAQLEYPVAFDFESAVAGVYAPRAAGLDKDQMTAIAQAFCDRIEKAGYYSMVYGNYYDLDMYHYKALEDKAIWWAEYDVAEPSPNMDIVMWQYDNSGWVSGISTVVDMNLDLSGVLE